MILFGPVARCQVKEHSDIDIIVASELRKRDVLPPFPRHKRLKSGWMIPIEDLRAGISFD